MLGTAHNLSTGFITCVIIASGATVLALLLIALARPAVITIRTTESLNV